MSIYEHFLALRGLIVGDGDYSHDIDKDHGFDKEGGLKIRRCVDTITKQRESRIAIPEANILHPFKLFR